MEEFSLNKDKRIYIRVNSTEYRIIKEAAKNRRMTVSKLLISLSQDEYLRQIAHPNSLPTFDEKNRNL